MMNDKEVLTRGIESDMVDDAMVDIMYRSLMAMVNCRSQWAERGRPGVPSVTDYKANVNDALSVAYW